MFLANHGAVCCGETVEEAFFNVYNTVLACETQVRFFFLMFEFPCIITLYYIKNQQDATLAVLFISHCNVTLHVSDAFCVRNV